LPSSQQAALAGAAQHAAFCVQHAMFSLQQSVEDLVELACAATKTEPKTKAKPVNILINIRMFSFK
jgi:hypothetical protein